MPGLRLVLPLSVQIDIALVQVQMIARDSDDTLDQEHIRIAGLEEDDDVPAVHGAIAHKGRPAGGRSEIGAVDQYVIAYEKCVLHRAGGNDEVLEDEGKDEEACHNNGAIRRQGFERSLAPGIAGGSVCRCCGGVRRLGH